MTYVFDACDELHRSRDHHDHTGEDFQHAPTKSYLPYFIPTSTRFVPPDVSDIIKVNDDTDANKTSDTFTFHYENSKTPLYYCDGRVVLKIEARLAAALSYITTYVRNKALHGGMEEYKTHDSVQTEYDTKLTLKPTENDSEKRLLTSIAIDYNNQNDSWRSARSYAAGCVLVRDLKESHEIYKKQIRDDNDENWVDLLTDVKNDADRLYSWIIDKLYDQPQSLEAQIYAIEQVANIRPLLRYNII